MMPATQQLPRYPVGFWNYVPIALQGPEAVRDWDEAGMTLPMGPEFGPRPDDCARMRAILDAAHARGLAVILCHAHGYWRHLADVGEKQYRQDFVAAVDALGSHPAVYGFNVGDEPGAEAFPMACRAMQIQREMAPHLRPFLNLINKGLDGSWQSHTGFNDWGAYLDAYVNAASPPVLCYDCYWQMTAGTARWDIYFENLRLFHEAATRHKLVYWTTLLAASHFGMRCPSEDDFRWQISTAAACGARGLLWFFFYMREPHGNYRVPPIDEHYERTATYTWLSRVCRTFQKTLAPVFPDLALQRCCFVGSTWGGYPLLDGAGLVQQADSIYNTPLIVSEFRHTDGSDYILVVNNSTTDFTQADLRIRGRRTPHQIGWLMQEDLPHSCKPHVGDDNVRLTPWLAPGQMELFRLEASN